MSGLSPFAEPFSTYPPFLGKKTQKLGIPNEFKSCIGLGMLESSVFSVRDHSSEFGYMYMREKNQETNFKNDESGRIWNA